MKKEINNIYNDEFKKYFNINITRFDEVHNNVMARFYPRSFDSLNKWHYMGQMAEIQKEIFTNINKEISDRYKENVVDIHVAYVRSIIADCFKLNSENNYIYDVDLTIDSPEKVIDSINNLTREYIYVVFNQFGMAVTVGKSTVNKKSCGDLFQRVDTRSLTGSANIILRSVYGKEKFKEVDDLLSTYHKRALLIYVDSIPKTELTAKQLEKKLGEYLKGKTNMFNDENVSTNKYIYNVPLLNYYSHLFP